MTSWVAPLGFGLLASVSTMLGGVLALKLAARATTVLAVAAGIVLGVAFFDLLPEAMEDGERTYSDRIILACTALGFGGYLLLVRLLAHAERGSRWQVHIGPASLTLHSFVDGLAMGLAFRISPELGWVIAIAVLTHDFADGVNTVTLAMNADRRRVTLQWLVLNGLAPLLGVVIGLTLDLPRSLLAPVMATFGGIFLYIGACDLVPRSLACDGRLRTTFAVLAGIVVMLGVTSLAE